MASKTSPPTPITNFSERCTDRHPRGLGPWLGIQRLTKIPDSGFPPRQICQSFISDDERQKGAELVKQCRQQEGILEKHDADRRQNDLTRLAGKNGFDAAQLRRELSECSYETFIAAQNRMSEIRKEARDLCVPILERLVSEFDRQLVELAIAREKELQSVGIEIFRDGLNSAGYDTRTFELHSDPILLSLQCRREIVRHKLDLPDDESIGCAQWLLTSEEHTPFHWL